VGLDVERARALEASRDEDADIEEWASLRRYCEPEGLCCCDVGSPSRAKSRHRNRLHRIELAAPQKVRFRYKLDSRDEEWQDYAPYEIHDEYRLTLNGPAKIN